MPHNKWLDWKIRNGLAVRGHAGGTMHPRNIFMGVLYKVYFKRQAPAQIEQTRGGQVFKQPVGGVVGSAGKVNGE